MKILEEIKNEVAIENGFENYDNLISDYGEKNPNWYDYGKKHPNNFDKYFDEIAKRYAKEVAIASLEKASENAKLKTFSTKNLTDFSKKMVDKSSITNEENIVL